MDLTELQKIKRQYPGMRYIQDKIFPIGRDR